MTAMENTAVAMAVNCQMADNEGQNSSPVDFRSGVGPGGRVI
jgi:hypothetical protein